MHEFVLCAWVAGREAAKQVHHAASDTGADPDVAVYNPQNVPLCFTIAPAQIPDLRIRSQVLTFAVVAGKVRVLFFHQYFCIKGGEVVNQLLKNRIYRVVAR